MASNQQSEDQRPPLVEHRWHPVESRDTADNADPISRLCIFTSHYKFHYPQFQTRGNNCVCTVTVFSTMPDLHVNSRLSKTVLDQLKGRKKIEKFSKRESARRALCLVRAHWDELLLPLNTRRDYAGVTADVEAGWDEEARLQKEREEAERMKRLEEAERREQKREETVRLEQERSEAARVAQGTEINDGDECIDNQLSVSECRRSKKRTSGSSQNEEDERKRHKLEAAAPVGDFVPIPTFTETQKKITKEYLLTQKKTDVAPKGVTH